jgi:hypothetical protein
MNICHSLYSRKSAIGHMLGQCKLAELSFLSVSGDQRTTLFYQFLGPCGSAMPPNSSGPWIIALEVFLFICILGSIAMRIGDINLLQSDRDNCSNGG